jgi:3-dehydroquinate synthase
MYERMTIKSRLHDYSVEFVANAFDAVMKDSDQRLFFIVDSLVYDLYREQVSSLFVGENYMLVQATESHKTYDFCGEIIRALVERKVRRNSRIIAIGGGIVQDISAFVASILFRGVEWSFVPTTLLAQADSCIGGKTSINVGGTKNLVGNFNPPRCIYVDGRFLNTLQVDDIRSGIGEILHFFLYADSHMTDKLFRDYDNIVSNRSLLKEYILESLRIKKSVIEVDEFDSGVRNKFNYGHTFGHALESITDYAIKHGQAVTVGMDIANMISHRLGLMDAITYENLAAILRINFPDYDLHSIDTEEYIQFLSKDKKNVDEQLVCILSEGPGMLQKRKIPMDSRFRETIGSYLSSQHSPVRS